MAFASYHSGIKSSSWFYPLGIFSGMIVNVLWMTIAKQHTDSTELVRLGLYWDAMLTVVYLSVPFVFFNIELTKIQLVGVAVIASGIFLTKL